jgi:hypothetical protein
MTMHALGRLKVEQQLVDGDMMLGHGAGRLRLNARQVARLVRGYLT